MTYCQGSVGQGAITPSTAGNYVVLCPLHTTGAAPSAPPAPPVPAPPVPAPPAPAPISIPAISIEPSATESSWGSTAMTPQSNYKGSGSNNLHKQSNSSSYAAHRGAAGQTDHSCRTDACDCSDSGQVTSMGSDSMVVNGKTVKMGGCTNKNYGQGKTNFSVADNITYEGYESEGNTWAKTVSCTD